MFSLKPAFDRTKESHRGIDTLTLLFWAVSIDNDRQQRDNERRLKRQAFAQAPRVPRIAPRPF